ncbi:hypothetical protein Y032_0249g123 [Ancylostoma ceylanicum]|uniref:Domain of unknown function DB domain-containing protein n=1 Tax=Ancylostoma ceylanicum TaxID=53326 RepID=A0A016SD66_9BILA|nr:hypothetical protein Y032_0249g123 [Ancylostoma ceylanicum]
MIPRSVVALAAIIHQIASQGVVLVQGDQPRRPSRVFRSQRRHDDLKAFDHDSTKHVIYAPLDGERVITKGIYYVNGKSKKDDQAYESMLLGGTENIDGIDPFFVTRPPQRTTVAMKYSSVADSLPPLSGQVNEVEEKESSKTTTRYPLRLVTIPPRTTTPLPPFKHVNRRVVSRNDDNNSTKNSPSENAYPTQGVKFPAEPWQIPPGPSMIGAMDSNQNLLAAPPNPFLPIMPVKELNISYPFLPIPKSSPPPQLVPPPLISPLAPPFGSSGLIHRSSLRQGSYVRNREVPAVPLPYKPGSAYVTVDADHGKKTVTETDFSIDGEERTVQNDDKVAKPYAAYRSIRPRSINGPYREQREEQNSSADQLRLFARNHPSIVKSVAKQASFKENQLILPKSYSAGRQVPSSSRARTSLTPNEKLDLCCRKRRVNPGCQAMCNFEALNDKTLVSAFLTNVCPGPQQRDAFDCASSKVDHSACCERAGLLTFHGGKCLPFCRTHAAQPANPLEFLPCLQVFEHIKACYREYQTTHPNILGD